MSQVLDLMQFPLQGSRLIEASAGTGKTFTLALLYTRLILGQGSADTAFSRPLIPREILVLTFTEAATQELRDRIRQRLVETADYFQIPPADAPGDTETSTAQPPCNDPLYDLRASYPMEEWQPCAHRLRLAAESMDEAVISTIHGWCNRMLLEHAFDTRGIFNRELVTDQTELLAEVVRDYWRVHFYPLDTNQAAAVLHAFSSPAPLQEKLQKLFGRRAAGVSCKGEKLGDISLQHELARQEAWLAKQAELQTMEDQARTLWWDDRQRIESHLWELRPHLNGNKHYSTTEGKFQSEIAGLGDWASGGKTPAKLKNYGQGCFTFKKGAGVQREMSHAAFQALADRFDREAQQPDDYAEPEPPLYACILAHAYPWVEREVEKRLLQRAEMGFDDLLTQLDKALDPALSGEHADHLANGLRREFPVALIDEFQDTDPVQYRIFDRIYRVEQNSLETALIMIGDPKQAIYSFRGADIHTYLAARDATLGRHYTLTTNFRSTQGVVNACNRLFDFAEAHKRGAFRFKTDAHNPLPFTPVEARGRAETLYLNGQAAAAVCCWTLGSDEALGIEDYQRESANIAASQITEWLCAAARQQAGFGTSDEITTPLRPADIAILVRTGKEAAVMRAALASRGVNSVYLSDRDSVFATEEAADLLHCLRACAAPTDERLIRAALGTNTLALPLSHLAQLQENELVWERAMQQFYEFRQCWQRQGVLAMLRQFMESFELASRLLKSRLGERKLTNLLHLAEWLQQSATSLDGEQALIRHLAEHLGQTRDEHILRLESDAELVKVITIHKSKGLEYPLVLLPFICAWRSVDGKTKPVPYRIGDELLFETSEKKQFEDAWTLADDDRLSEDMRLLYVAATRARHALWMTVAGVKSGGAKKPQLEKSALGYLLRGGQRFDSVQSVHEALATLKGDCGDIQLMPAPTSGELIYQAEATVELDDARTLEDLKLTPWWIASYSALTYGALSKTPPPGLELPADEREFPLATSAVETSSRPSPDTPAEAHALEETGDPSVSHVPPPPAEQGLLHELPRGSYYGTFLHGLLEWAAEQRYRDERGHLHRGFAAAAAAESLRLDMLSRRCHLRGLKDWIEPLSDWLGSLLTQPWNLSSLPGAGGEAPQLILAELPPRQVQVELEFWIESHAVDARQLDRLVTGHTLACAPRPQVETSELNGLFKGFIDLVVEHEERYYVVDWKSNWLGDSDAAYHRETMLETVLNKRYDLQYVLYLLALHRQLSARLPAYDYDQHIGGAVYVFLRGNHSQSQGLFTDKPPRELIEQLDVLFSGGDISGEALQYEDQPA